MADDRIDDDEIVMRRIPPDSPWFENESPTSANFKLDRRRNEQGLSVYRASIVRPDQVLNMPEAIEGSRVARARVGDIRALRSGNGAPLHLDVVVVDDADNPGHAEI